MKTRVCTKCGIEKPIIYFSFRKDKNNYHSICKLCLNLINKKYRKENKNNIAIKDRIRAKIRKSLYPWKGTLTGIKQRCNNPKNCNYKEYGQRGIKCLITEEELKFLWFRDKAYSMKQPSIDRIDNDGDYELSNCRFIELKINSGRSGYKHCKVILQFDLKGNLIKEWPSIKVTSNELGINYSNIRSVVQGKQKTAGGFIWKYK